MVYNARILFKAERLYSDSFLGSILRMRELQQDFPLTAGSAIRLHIYLGSRGEDGR